MSVCVCVWGARWPPELEGRAQSFQNLDPPPRILGPTLVQLGSSVQINHESG